MTTQNVQVLSEAIMHKYKSLDNPDYSFVTKSISSRPYDPLIQEMRGLFEVEEITDSNDDVSFCYVLSNTMNQWEVQLSMIGLYAVIFRKARQSELVTFAISEQEEKILSLLSKYQFEVLQQQILEQPFALKLFNTEPENTRFYQTLFSDTDVLPWES